MATFSVTDAAFAGFRLLHDRPKVVLAWAVFFLVTGLVNALILIATGAGESFVALQALQASGSQDPAALMGALTSLGPAFLILLALSLTFNSIVFAAAYRAYLRPGDTAVGAIRFGADELRMAALLVLMFVVWVAYLFVAVFLFALLIAAGKAVGSPFAALIDLIGTFVMIAALAYPWVRLSLAAPMTLDQGRIVLFRSWSLTHGHFWRLFLTYMLTTAVLGLVFLLSVIVIAGILALAAVAMGVGLEGLGRMAQPDFSSFASYLNPGVLLSLVLNALLSAGLLVIWAGPTAEAYRALKAGQPSSPGDRFN